jgi:FkbM family methyltransferase
MLKNIIYYFTSVLAYYHERKIINKLNLLNFHPKIILDVGAHIGEMTEIFLKNFTNINKIYCFEPQKKIFSFLKNKFKKNPKVVCINKACSDKITVSAFNISFHRRSSSLEKINTNNFYHKIKSFIVLGKIRDLFHSRVKIRTITLDKFLKNRISLVDLLKIDVEGSELKVLKGCKKNIKNIKVILIEILNHNLINNYSAEDIFYFFKKNNFELFTVCKFPLYRFEDRIYINRKFFNADVLANV